MRTDLIKIQKILIGQGRSDLGKLFNNAYGELIQSDSYGRGLFSYISTYKIHYSIENECVINKMTDDDKNVVNTAILKLYPHENHKPEIRKIEYVPHFNEEFVVESESLIRIDFEYVRRQSIKSEEKISSEDYEGSITNSRTLLESLLKYIIHERGKELDENGDLNKLFKIALKDFPFDNNHLANENFRIALRGATSIVIL